MRLAVKGFDDTRRLHPIVHERVFVLLNSLVAIYDHRSVVLVLHLVFDDLLVDLAVGVAIVRIRRQILSRLYEFFDRHVVDRAGHIVVSFDAGVAYHHVRLADSLKVHR